MVYNKDLRVEFAVCKNILKISFLHKAYDVLHNSQELYANLVTQNRTFYHRIKQQDCIPFFPSGLFVFLLFTICSKGQIRCVQTNIKCSAVLKAKLRINQAFYSASIAHCYFRIF